MSLLDVSSNSLILYHNYFILYVHIAKTVPFTAINISSTVGQTNCTIYFTIPFITYTPEIYHINYIGLELQNTLTTSSSLVGTDNLIAVNLMYQITLTGLEEANTYNFTVVSTNCIGNTSSETMSFSTLPACTLIIYSHFYIFFKYIFFEFSTK